MCLYIDERHHKRHTPKIAYKDIRVWKILIKTPEGLLSAYRRVPYEKHLQYTTKGPLTVTFPVSPTGFIFGPEVHEGYHAYLNLEEAKNWCDIRNRDLYEELPDHAEVFEAYIPKGSEYFIGCLDDVATTALYVQNEIV